MTATMIGDHSRAEELAAELTPTQSRFTLLVLAEYLTQALSELANHADADRNELWRGYCLRTEQAIQQVSRPSDG